MTTATTNVRERARPMTGEEKKVILASSAGTIFEWYDFYLYGSLAAIIGAQFFTPFPEATRGVFALLAFAAGFIVRPFGALVFGALGDLIGRKYTFLMTILIMGLSTFLVGLLPNYYSWGVAAPVLLIALRMLQGLALGGEYGGAAVYVAEHAPADRRGFYTAFIQTTATLGLLLSLLVIMGVTSYVNGNFPEQPVLDAAGVALMNADGSPQMMKAFNAWGWRIPFLGSIFLLAISLYIRLQMSESPAFKKMKEEGSASKAPLSEAFGPPRNALVLLIAPVLFLAAWFSGALSGTIAQYIGMLFVGVAVIWGWLNARIALIALLGLVAGQAVVWYAGQFYALFFMQNVIKVDGFSANVFGQDRPQADHPGRLPDRGADLQDRVPASDGSCEPDAACGAPDRGDRHCGSGRLLVPVQPGRKCEVHQVLRHRQGAACTGVSELQHCRRRGGVDCHREDRRDRGCVLRRSGEHDGDQRCESSA